MSSRPVKDAENLINGPHSYDRYGFRVPAVIVSPYARPDYVCSEVLDHTSVLKLVEKKWNLPALTARDAAATPPLDALDFTAPQACLDPPVLPEPSLKWGSTRPAGQDGNPAPARAPNDGVGRAAPRRPRPWAAGLPGTGGIRAI